MRLATDNVDLALDPTNWDLMFTDDGDLAFVTGKAAVAQEIKFALQLFREEWFLEPSAGFPWLQEVLGYKWDQSRLRSLFLEVIEGVESVKSVDRLALSFNPTTRALTVEYGLTTEFGETLETAVTLDVTP